MRDAPTRETSICSATHTFHGLIILPNQGCYRHHYWYMDVPYYRLKDNYESGEWDSSLLLCKYMKMDYFLDMLKTRTLFVGQKCSFDDLSEQNLSFKDCPVFYLANSKVSDSKLEQDQKIKEELCNQYHAYSALPASCWTHDVTENVFMWTVYADKYGVRIKTTLKKILDNLELEEYQVVCDKMIYRTNYPRTKVENLMFYKRIFFRDEKEFRFYFVPQTYEAHCLLNVNERIKLKIRNPVDMIDEVMISPFIHHTSCISEYLTKQFMFHKNQIKKSQIKINEL